jgi:hypothetical protein
MSAFEEFLHLLQKTMERPENFGLFHICFLILTAVFAVLLICFFRNGSEKTVRRLLLGVWLTIVCLEIYKQLVFSMQVENGVATWNYQWYAFPFQFCSTPLYALPFIIFLKDGWLRRSFMIFFTGFSMFAGIAVMMYPNDVFVPMIGINIQTMIHHGSQVAIGAFLVAYGRKHFKLKYLAGSLLIFACFAAVAMLLNEGVHDMIVNRGLDDEFNMFYISPHYPCTLPVLSIVYDKMPYAVFLPVYLLGFSFISAVFFCIEKGIVSLSSFLYNKVKGAKAA